MNPNQLFKYDAVKKLALVQLKVKPSSKFDQIDCFEKNYDENATSGQKFAYFLKLSVKSPPDKGKANQEVIKLLAENLKLSKNCLEISTGRTNTSKILTIFSLEEKELQEKLAPFFKN
uniref:Uncharacterized protein n=1 Tax=Romanomermis culicivorax TaxID=13658 RepID=A0A915I7Q7_ROMCU